MAPTNDQQKAKPATDAYTGMLAVSLAALLIGSAVLFLDYSRYPDKPPQKLDMSAYRERGAPDSFEPKNKKAPDDTPPDAPEEKKEPDKQGGRP